MAARSASAGSASESLKSQRPRSWPHAVCPHKDWCLVVIPIVSLVCGIEFCMKTVEPYCVLESPPYSLAAIRSRLV